MITSLLKGQILARFALLTTGVLATLASTCMSSRAATAYFFSENNSTGAGTRSVQGTWTTGGGRPTVTPNAFWGTFTIPDATGNAELSSQKGGTSSASIYYYGNPTTDYNADYGTTSSNSSSCISRNDCLEFTNWKYTNGSNASGDFLYFYNTGSAYSLQLNVTLFNNGGYMSISGVRWCADNGATIDATNSNAYTGCARNRAWAISTAYPLDYIQVPSPPIWAALIPIAAISLTRRIRLRRKKFSH